MKKMGLEGCDLSGAELYGTSLAGLDLRSCGVQGIRVSENCAELRGAKMDMFQAAEMARLLGIEIL